MEESGEERRGEGKGREARRKTKSGYAYVSAHRQTHRHKEVKQESSAKLTNQRVSYAFTSSPFSFHSRHILPACKFQHSYSCIFTVRRYALHGICDSNSVCPSVRPSVRLSVCHTRGLCPHGSTYDHDFFTTG